MERKKQRTESGGQSGQRKQVCEDAGDIVEDARTSSGAQFTPGEQSLAMEEVEPDIAYQRLAQSIARKERRLKVAKSVHRAAVRRLWSAQQVNARLKEQNITDENTHADHLDKRSTSKQTHI